jgi:hypothetical protein
MRPLPDPHLRLLRVAAELRGAAVLRADLNLAARAPQPLPLGLPRKARREGFRLRLRALPSLRLRLHARGRLTLDRGDRLIHVAEVVPELPLNDARTARRPSCLVEILDQTRVVAPATARLRNASRKAPFLVLRRCVRHRDLVRSLIDRLLHVRVVVAGAVGLRDLRVHGRPLIRAVALGNPFEDVSDVVVVDVRLSDPAFEHHR